MSLHWRFFSIVFVTICAAIISLPKSLPISFSAFGNEYSFTLKRPTIGFFALGMKWMPDLDLKQGLDIQGGMQLVLDADMSNVAVEDREIAHESARAVIERRVDLFGINESLVQTARTGDAYRVIVELAGISDPDQALQLLGTTAQLEFRLQRSKTDFPSATDTSELIAFFESFEQTGLKGEQLRRASVNFDPTTGEPIISLEFNPEGRDIFAQITRENVGAILGIFLDDMPLTLPRIQVPILDGQAQITGGFELEEAKQLAIQLNAGALPVPIEVLEQRIVGATLGQSSVQASVQAGIIGFIMVMAFMILIYGWSGLLASFSLLIYGVITLSVYKLLGVTVTLPGIAGLLLSVAMAVDATVLILERMKEELRLGKPFQRAMSLGFGRAWDSIRDANLATLVTSLVLVNPANLGFLNTSGVVRGFGITLLIGIGVGLFSGVFVMRTLMELFLAPPNNNVDLHKVDLQKKAYATKENMRGKK
jgi:preprotein translocase subunit SecD